jgi:hypothetical protein
VGVWRRPVATPCRGAGPPDPPGGGDPPSAGKLRVAQAELVGWLEGLTAAIQSVMVAPAVGQERDGQGP